MYIDQGFTAFSLPVQFAPRSKSANRTLADSLPGSLVPWNFRSPERNGRPSCSRERKFLRTFAPWNFGSGNIPSVNPGHYYAICYLQPLDDSAAAACRKYPTGFQQPPWRPTRRLGRARDGALSKTCRDAGTYNRQRRRQRRWDSRDALLSETVVQWAITTIQAGTTLPRRWCLDNRQPSL